MVEMDELLWRLYNLENDFEKFQDSQRTSAVNIILVITGAVLTVLGFKKTLTIVDVPLTIFLVALGIYGFIFAWKLHERYEWHELLAATYFNALDSQAGKKDYSQLKWPSVEKILGEDAWKKWKQEKQGIDGLWGLAQTVQVKKYPHLWKMRQWKLYLGIPAAVAIIGFILTLIAIFAPVVST
jgi:hypothetical protein